MTREEQIKALGDEIVQRARVEAINIGADLEMDAIDVGIYAAERAEILAQAVGEPGFEMALKAERDNVALKLAVQTVERADDIDARVLSAIRGSLGLAARSIRIFAGIPPVV